MSNFTKLANSVFAPVNSDGTARQIAPQDAQRWGTELERILLGLAAGELDIEFPYGFIPATNSAGGSANAIRATTALPIPTGDASALIALPIVAANTGPATVRFGNGAVLPIRTVAGEDLKANDLTAGMVVAGYISDGNFRLITDPNSLMNKLAAEAAQALSEAARDIAAGYASDAVSQGNVPIYSSIVGLPAIEVPTGISAIRANGYAAAGDMGPGALLTDGNNGTPPLIASGGATARDWYLVKGQNDVRALGADAMVDATAAFVSMRDRLGKGELIEAGENVVGGLQLSDQNIRAQKLKAVPGADEILKLGYRTPGWDYRKVTGFFEGDDDQFNLDNAPNGIVYTADASPEYAGRWAIENAFFWYFDKAIVAPAGNIGNTYDHVSVLHCNYGFYAEPNLGGLNGGSGDMMQPGCQIFGAGEWAACKKAAFYIDGGPPGSNVSNGQLVWNDTIIETNEGFGVFVKDYGQAWTPLSFNRVWFEHNALDKTPIEMPDGETYIPRDVLLKRVEHAVFNECSIWDFEFIDSNVLLDKCRLSDISTITSSGSTVRATNAHTFGLVDQPIMVESYTHAAMAAGGRADRIWMHPRLNRVHYPPFRGSGGIVASHSDPAGGVFAGGVAWASVPFGMAYPNCAEFTVPAGGVALIGDFDADPFDVVMYSVDIMLLDGAVPNVSFTGGNTLCGNLGPLLRQQSKWYTVGGIARCTATGLNDVGLYIIAPPDQSVAMRLGVVQAIKFGEMAEAVHYFNANCYVHSAT